MKMLWVAISVAFMVATLVSVGSVAHAQGKYGESQADQKFKKMPFEELAKAIDRDPNNVRQAFSAAKEQIRHERISDRLAYRVKNGKITEEQRIAIEDWLNSAPKAARILKPKWSYMAPESRKQKHRLHNSHPSKAKKTNVIKDSEFLQRVAEILKIDVGKIKAATLELAKPQYRHSAKSKLEVLKSKTRSVAQRGKLTREEATERLERIKERWNSREKRLEHVEP